MYGCFVNESIAANDRVTERSVRVEHDMALFIEVSRLWHRRSSFEPKFAVKTLNFLVNSSPVSC